MASLAGIASTYGLWAMGGTIALLALSWLLRGRIRIEKGWAGFNVVRFSWIERFTHWLLALSFVVLALTGVVIQQGTSLVAGALLGPRVFADVIRVAGPTHIIAGILFAASLAVAFILWVRHSLPHWRDLVWMFKGGGLVVRGVHPPALKFNAGQKLLFWFVMLAGAWLSWSGAALLLLHAPTPGYPLDVLGTAGHRIPALVLTCAVIVHIYLRTIGIQGAASAMISGEVDANWARQHHSLWAEEELRRIEDAAQAEVAANTAATSAAP
jgi:formate dehydrogenase subunit gamma